MLVLSGQKMDFYEETGRKREERRKKKEKRRKKKEESNTFTVVFTDSKPTNAQKKDVSMQNCFHKSIEFNYL
jgi:hypothetical protein